MAAAIPGGAAPALPRRALHALGGPMLRPARSAILAICLPLWLGGCWLTAAEQRAVVGDDTDPPVVDTDDTDPDSDADSDVETDGVDTDTDTDTETDTALPQCWDADLSPTMALSWDNSTRADTVQLSCGEAGGPDRLVLFEAARAGCYVFSTDHTGTAVDSVLALLDGCGGTELACNDDVDKAAVRLASEIHTELAAGDSRVVVASGFDGGNPSLGVTILTVERRANAPTAFDATLTSMMSGDATDSFNGRLSASSGLPNPGCASAIDAHRVYRWTAPSTGTWRLRVVSSSHDVSLSAYRPCGGPAIRCSDARTSGAEVFTLDLDAGEELRLRVGVDFGLLDPLLPVNYTLTANLVTPTAP